MHLILTHEQADFDAIAALFAASALDGGLPILPRRMNRNVRAFISLYGLEFPFVDPRDLPQGPVESVTLVDTQSMVTLKGMGSGTSVRVIDHHPLRKHTRDSTTKAIPADWERTSLELGATTTYFAEQLQDRGQMLTPIQATLLLLQERVPKGVAPSTVPEEEATRRPTAAAHETPMRVFSDPDTPAPEVQLLSNGRWHTMVTQAGGGWSRWNKTLPMVQAAGHGDISHRVRETPRSVGGRIGGDQSAEQAEQDDRPQDHIADGILPHLSSLE